MTSYYMLTRDMEPGAVIWGILGDGTMRIIAADPRHVPPSGVQASWRMATLSPLGDAYPDPDDARFWICDQGWQVEATEPLAQSPDSAFLHVAGFWQGLLDRLRIKVPRALCGASLIAEPGDPDPLDLLACPKCRWRSDFSVIARIRNRWRYCCWCGEPASAGTLCRQCRAALAAAVAEADSLAELEPACDACGGPQAEYDLLGVADDGRIIHGSHFHDFDDEYYQRRAPSAAMHSIAAGTTYDPSAMDKAWDENWRIGDRSPGAVPS
jgi:hypothetical protein